MKLFTSDKKMLELFSILHMEGKVKTQKEFAESIGIYHVTFSNIKNGTGRLMHFTPDHIEKACNRWKVDANWFFGFSRDPFQSNISRNIKAETH